MSAQPSRIAELHATTADDATPPVVPPTSKGPELFERWSMPRLLAADRTFRWLVRGVLTDPTYGETAGEAKSFKTYVTTFLAVAVASGAPFLDRFNVERPGPVLIYAGEGGRIHHTRLLERVAAALDVDLGTLPISTTYQVAPVRSRLFQDSLERDLRELEPALFVLDPLYAFHGSATNASNLHEEGSLLTGLSSRCVEAGTTCWIVNHFNQSGTGRDLKRITQAGSTEWVHSWMLIGHRSPPDVAQGRIRLVLDVGSREWGGSSWELDLDVGRFDENLGAFDSPISWEIRRAGGTTDTPRSRAVDAVIAHPGEFGKEELAKKAGGNLEAARKEIDRLVADGVLATALVFVTRSNNRRDRVTRYFTASEFERCGTQQVML